MTIEHPIKSYFLLVAVVTASLFIIATSVLGQSHLLCPCSILDGSNCINLSLTEIPRLESSQCATKLNASFNKITVLNKDSLKHIPTLTHLNLSYNGIADIHPQTFSTLKNLNFLDLSSNNITSIASDTFMYNGHLEWLSLANNRMFRLPNENFLRLPQLLFCNLSRCNLQTIHPDTFSNIQELRELYLDNNKIAFLSTRVFRHLYHLQKLDLCYNSLQNFDAQVFSYVLDLRSLSLCHNNVSRINITFLNVVFRIDDLNLEGNPWVCDCDFAEVYHICANEKKCSLKLTCEFPDNLRQKHWDVIDRLKCMSAAVPRIVEASPEVETTSITHQMTLQRTKQAGLAVHDLYSWYTLGLSVLCLLVLILIASLCIVITSTKLRNKRMRVRNEVEESSSSGGFSERRLEFGSREEIGMRTLIRLHRSPVEEDVGSY